MPNQKKSEQGDDVRTRKGMVQRGYQSVIETRTGSIPNTKSSFRLQQRWREKTKCNNNNNTGCMARQRDGKEKTSRNGPNAQVIDKRERRLCVKRLEMVQSIVPAAGTRGKLSQRSEHEGFPSAG